MGSKSVGTRKCLGTAKSANAAKSTDTPGCAGTAKSLGTAKSASIVKSAGTAGRAGTAKSVGTAGRAGAAQVAVTATTSTRSALAASPPALLERKGVQIVIPLQFQRARDEDIPCGQQENMDWLLELADSLSGQSTCF